MNQIQRKCARALIALASVFSFVTSVQAEQPLTTVVTVREMCGGCVKSINARLKDLPGVAKVTCDTKAKTVTIVPLANMTVSSRELWKAMAEIGKTPVKLSGPQGTFTAEPKS